MTRYPQAQLGEVVQLEIDEVDVDPASIYELAGVYSFGRGLLRRSAVAGSETSYKKLTRLHEGSLVVSRLKAFEGAVAVVTPPFSGLFVSQEFPTFTPKPGRLDSRYLSFLCRSPGFWRQLQGLSKGVGARRERVHAEDVLQVRVPLPHLDEQRRIAGRLESVMALTVRLRTLNNRASVVDVALAEALVQDVLDRGIRSGWPVRAIGDVAEVNPSPTHLTEDAEVSFVPMRAVDDQTGTIASAELRPSSEVSGYKQFRIGDVIFARITPCMQNGKAAVVRGIDTEFAVGSTEFHVIRPSDEVLADWIHCVGRTARFRGMAAARFTGTAGQQRVPASFLESAKIPVPNVSVQRAALTQLDRIRTSALSARRARDMQKDRIYALEVSILNHVMAG